MLFRKFAHVSCSSFPSRLFLDVSCVMHAQALTMKTGIERIDAHLERLGCRRRFFPVLTKVVHLWRERARAIITVWTQLHGSESAMAYAKRMLPRCISGRWGSIGETERTLVSVGACRLVPVLDHVLAKSSTHKPQPHAPVTVQCLALRRLQAHWLPMITSL